MVNGRKALVKTEGRSSDLTASSADESGKRLALESEKHCDSFTMLNMRGTVSVGQANRSSTLMPKGERKYKTKRVERYFI